MPEFIVRVAIRVGADDQEDAENRVLDGLQDVWNSGQFIGLTVGNAWEAEVPAPDDWLYRSPDA